ncbi:methyltransferase domain-containing protein [Haladaptatus sp. T7]|uniref:class I SAM-dependent methyltransferase n=1 Tax=Haladaptatus sp. T7 TaxID=2029368 RepID=UPI002795E2EC|nr:methyltransferase domain-containing protein [Haladaptatus sp. T7]
MTDDFHRDLSHLTWEEVYDRQVARDEYVSRWLDEISLETGDVVVEVGSGPGHTALRTAQRVGPSGTVYAVERNGDALRYLQRTMDKTDVGNVEPIHADAEALPVRFNRPVVALLTYVLHHADHPTRLLAELSQALPTESRLFVCEYHPNGPGEEGPPINHRLAPDRLHDWLGDTGFEVDRLVGFENESYAFVCRRTAGDSGL